LLKQASAQSPGKISVVQKNTFFRTFDKGEKHKNGNFHRAKPTLKSCRLKILYARLSDTLVQDAAPLQNLESS